MVPDCECLAIGPRFPDAAYERQIGLDETDGLLADVRVIKCTLCNRLWLKYHVESDAFSRSGRWIEALIDDETARRITPEQASDFIESQPWYVFGGSYWGHAGKRALGSIFQGP